MDWEVLLERGIEKGEVRELYLYQVPLLKTCDNWSAVKEVGRVDFKGKHANYNGGLIRYANKIYFVPEARIQALSPYRKWNFKAKLKVGTEAEVQKKAKKR